MDKMTKAVYENEIQMIDKLIKDEQWSKDYHLNKLDEINQKILALQARKHNLLNEFKN